MSEFYVTVAEILKVFRLETIVDVPHKEEIKVSVADINRPALPLVGYYEYFDPERIQIIGKVETTYLNSLTNEGRANAFRKLFAMKIPCLIFTRNLEVYPEAIEAAKQNNTPIFRSDKSTSLFMAGLNDYLHSELAPRMTQHGVLVEVYGEGVLLMAESGVGKSEAAIELVKRGHRLVADDSVEIKRINDFTLSGSAPEIIRHFVELRGIGIIDVKNIFGMGAVKDTEKIDLIIHLEIWNQNKQYDRLGLDTEYTELLGVRVPSLVLPVRPGRNLAVIIEVAAMNNRQKRMGYNAAESLNDRLLENMTFGDPIV